MIKIKINKAEFDKLVQEKMLHHGETRTAEDGYLIPFLDKENSMVCTVIKRFRKSRKEYYFYV